jgi:hypothetical protein
LIVTVVHKVRRKVVNKREVKKSKLNKQAMINKIKKLSRHSNYNSSSK